MFLPTFILRMPRKTTKRTFRAFFRTGCPMVFTYHSSHSSGGSKASASFALGRASDAPIAFSCSCTGLAPMKFKDATLGRSPTGNDRHFW